MTRIMIQSDTPQAQAFIDFARTLPFVKVDEKPKRTLKQAAKEYDAVYSVEDFGNELRRGVSEHFRNA